MVHSKPFFADCSLMFSPKVRGIFATIPRIYVMRSIMFTEIKRGLFYSRARGQGPTKGFFVKTGCQ